MSSAQQWLDVVSNNLANASTVGFKKDGVAFDDGLVKQLALQGGSGRSIGSMGSGAIIREIYTDFSEGILEATGNPLDLALDSMNTAFAVQTPAGIRFTRGGSFQLNGQRQIVDKSGYLLLDKGNKPISVGSGKISVRGNGIVQVDGKDAGEIAVYSGRFNKMGASLYTSPNAQQISDSKVVSGSLESSNVNSIEEMIAMIRINRAFELAEKTVQSQDESTTKLVSSLQGR